MKRFFLLTGFIFVALGVLFGQVQYKSKYPDIPIVDVHIHIGGFVLTITPDDVPATGIINYLKVSETIKQKYGSNLAFWINVNEPGTAGPEMKVLGNNRVLHATSIYQPHRGLSITADEVISKVQHEGYTGLKFWFGDPKRVLTEGQPGITEMDNAVYDEFFSALERENVLLTSLHIADPNGPFGNRQNWMADPVYFWKQIRAFENVVAKYPNLTIVAAHCVWLVCQDAQIDYLRYMLSTYPNLYCEIAATFQYMPLVNYDNLRNFYIEYQDRIMFGTDGGNVADSAIESTADRYASTFAILETDQMVNSGRRTIQGLNLPREVLEKIYYKNALKLYPGLKEAIGLR